MAIDRRRMQFLAMAALFIGPALIALVLYYGGSTWRPASTTQRGELIDPAIPLPAVSLATPAGGHVTRGDLEGKWTLLYIGEGSCPETCRRVLADLRQVRLALGKDVNRVQRLFLHRGACCDQAFFAGEHPGLLIARADDPEGRRLLEVFPSHDGVPAPETARWYIIDPLGNLMMSYAVGTDPRNTLKDLKKLLRLSHIG